MNCWERCLTSPNVDINTAINIIDATEARIALIIDDNKKLLGTVTDYDVRKHILEGRSLDDSITDIINASPKYGKIMFDDEHILKDMIAKGVRQLPILNDNHEVVDLKILEDFDTTKKKKNVVVLMAGGLGMRLRPLTENCPKPLLNVGEKPILEIILNNFIREGFEEFYISVNYKADMIENYFGDGSKFGVNIRYIHESKRLGTAGALGALPKGIKEPVIVMNGDLLTKVKFSQMLDFHSKHKSVATMCAREFQMQVPYGVVNFEDWKIKSLEEKPTITHFVNAGIYILNPEVVAKINKNEYLDMPDLFNELIEEGKNTLIFPIREFWLDIGRMEDFERARNEFASQE